MFVCCIMTLLTHFFTILLLRSLDCFISTTLYRCYFAFCQSSLNEYEWMNAWFVVKKILIKNSVRQCQCQSSLILYTWMAWCVRCVSQTLIAYWQHVCQCIGLLCWWYCSFRTYCTSCAACTWRVWYDFFTSVMFNAAKSVWLFVTKSKQSYEYVSRFFVGGKSMVTEYIH